MAWGNVHEIDLNCLDIEEAIAITKQRIYDLAEDLAQKQPSETAVLAVLCAKDHYISDVAGEAEE